jgi:hypothetical protein
LLGNFRLGSKSLAETNTLAFLRVAPVTKKESVIALALVTNLTNIFYCNHAVKIIIKYTNSGIDYAEKSFITLTLVTCTTKLFTVVINTVNSVNATFFYPSLIFLGKGCKGLHSG